MTIHLSHPGRIRAQVASLELSFEPGEHIVAETFGQAGRVPWWEGPATYAAYAFAAFGVFLTAALFIAGKPIHAAATIWILTAPFQVASLAVARRKPTYIVVTTLRVYLLRIPSRRREQEPIIRIPLTYVRIGADRAGRFRRVVRLEGAPFPMQGLQFLVTGRWRADLDSVVEAIRARRGGDAALPAAAG